MTNQQTHDFMTWTAEQAEFICRTVMEARRDELEQIKKLDEYQINGHDILPNMSVWVFKRKNLDDRLAQLDQLLGEGASDE